MSFAQFEQSPKGKRIRPLILNSESVKRMEVLSEHRRPALLAIAEEIEQVAPDLTDTEKQHVGRWIHRVLGPRGWRPVDKKRMPAGSLFSMAAVYARISMPADYSSDAPVSPHSGDAASRLKAARAGIKRLPHKPESVSEFLAAKRLAARKER